MQFKKNEFICPSHHYNALGDWVYYRNPETDKTVGLRHLLTGETRILPHDEMSREGHFFVAYNSASRIYSVYNEKGMLIRTIETAALDGFNTFIDEAGEIWLYICEKPKDGMYYKKIQHFMTNEVAWEMYSSKNMHVNGFDKDVMMLREKTYPLPNYFFEFVATRTGAPLFTRDYSAYVQDHIEDKKHFYPAQIRCFEEIKVCKYPGGYMGISKKDGAIVWNFPTLWDFVWRGDFMHFLMHKVLVILDPRTGKYLDQDVSGLFEAYGIRYWGHDLLITEDNWLLFAAGKPEDGGLFPPVDIWGFNLHDYTLHKLIDSTEMKDGRAYPGIQYTNGRLFIPMSPPEGISKSITTIWERQR